MREQWRRIIDNLRSGLSFKMLGWAVDIAPASEKASISLAVFQHTRRI